MPFIVLLVTYSVDNDLVLLTLLMTYAMPTFIFHVSNTVIIQIQTTYSLFIKLGTQFFT